LHCRNFLFLGGSYAYRPSWPLRFQSGQVAGRGHRTLRQCPALVAWGTAQGRSESACLPELLLILLFFLFRQLADHAIVDAHDCHQSEHAQNHHQPDMLIHRSFLSIVPFRRLPNHWTSPALSRPEPGGRVGVGWDAGLKGWYTICKLSNSMQGEDLCPLPPEARFGLGLKPSPPSG
jgi:hypothetical protein